MAALARSRPLLAFGLLSLVVGVAALPNGMHVKVSRWSGGTTFNQSAVVRIGAALTLSHVNDMGPTALAMRHGFELYFGLLNKLRGGISIGGVLHAVELTWIDDENDEHLVAPIIRHLVDEVGIRLLLGPCSSALTEQAASVAQQRGALLVASGASDPNIFRGRPLVFGTLMPEARTLPPAIELVSSLGARSVAILQEDTPSMLEACGAMLGLAHRHDLRIDFTWSLKPNAGAESVAAAAARIAEVAADVVVGCVHDNLCHELVRSLESRNFNPKAIIFTTCLTASGYLQQFGIADQYVIGTVPWGSALPLTSELTPWNASTFSKQYVAQFQGESEPPYQAALAFATCEALVYAIEQAGSVEPAAVAGALQGMDKQSVFGRMAFDENGQSLNQAKVVQFQRSSQYHVVAPPAIADRPVRYPKPTWTEQKCFETSMYFRYGFMWNATSGMYACQRCPPGKIAMFDTNLSHRVCQNCSAGHSIKAYPDRQDETFCEACPSGTYNTQAGSTGECSVCPEGFFQSLRGQTGCTACAPGRFASFSGSERCELCGAVLTPDGSPTFSPRFGEDRCTTCPDNGLCEADANGLFSSFTNQDGYYLHCDHCENGTGNLYRCPHGIGSACLARGRCLSDPETLEVAMEGPLCGACRQGFGRSDWLFGNCQKCPSTNVVIFGSLLNFFLLDLVVGSMTMMTAFKDFSKPTHIHSSLLKQLLNYLQMSAVAFSATDFDISLDIKSLCRQLQGILGLRSTGFSDLSTWCLVDSYISGTTIPKVMTVAGLIWVPAWVLFDVTIFGILSWWCWIMGWRRPRKRFLMSFITLKLYISLTRITELTLIPFGCYYADTSRLLMNTKIDCTSDDHWTWTLIGLLGFICLSLGIPLLLFLILRRYKVQDRLMEPETQAVFGFLFNGLEPNLYYFECIFMLRKVLFLFLVSLPGHSEVSGTVQCFSLTFVSGFFLLLHLWFRPYDNRAYFLLDETEAASLLAVFLTLVAQIGLWSTEGSMVFQLHTTYRRICRTLVYAIVFGMHVRFLMLLLWGFLRRATIDICFKGNPPAWLSKGRVRATKDGLQLSGLSRSAQLLLEGLFTEMIGMFAAHNGHISYSLLQTAVERICVHANYITKKRKYARLDPLKQHNRFLQQKAELLPVGGELVKEALKKIETSVRSSRLSGMSQRSSKDLVSEKLAQAMDMGVYFNRTASLGEAIEQLSEFSDANRARAYESSFTVEDLHEALLLLGKKVCDGRPEEDVATEGDDIAMRSYHAEAESDVSSDFGLASLGADKVLESQLRAATQNYEKEHSLAEAAIAECDRLRRQLAKLEYKEQYLVQGISKEAPDIEACMEFEPEPVVSPKVPKLEDMGAEEDPQYFSTATQSEPCSEPLSPFCWKLAHPPELAGLAEAADDSAEPRSVSVPCAPRMPRTPRTPPVPEEPAAVRATSLASERGPESREAGAGRPREFRGAGGAGSGQGARGPGHGSTEGRAGGPPVHLRADVSEGAAASVEGVGVAVEVPGAVDVDKGASSRGAAALPALAVAPPLVAAHPATTPDMAGESQEVVESSAAEMATAAEQSQPVPSLDGTGDQDPEVTANLRNGPAYTASAATTSAASLSGPSGRSRPPQNLHSITRELEEADLAWERVARASPDIAVPFGTALQAAAAGRSAHLRSRSCGVLKQTL